MRSVRVLFVCTGNICRSPTAEAVLRAKVAAAGLGDRIEVASCGTHDYHVGDPPDRRAIVHAKRRGYDLTALRASCFSHGDAERHDLLIALDRSHERFLENLVGRGKVRLLMSYIPDAGRSDVPDPYYGGAAAFEHALDLIERACDRVVEELRRELDGPG